MITHPHHAERSIMKKSLNTLFAIAGLLVAGSSLQAMAQDNPMHGEGMHGDGPPPMLERFDANHDGKLSKDEVRNGVDKMFTEIDSNKDGFISKEEMRAHHKAMHEQMHSKMQERWKAADKDGDGALSRAELEAAGMKRPLRNFDKLDKNKDGKLTPDEMREGMRMRHQEGMPAK
jgi:Ca2+-binding EF-hand superfamily protein